MVVAYARNVSPRKHLRGEWRVQAGLTFAARTRLRPSEAQARVPRLG